MDQFKNLDAQVIGISVDSVYSHMMWTELDRKKGGVGGLSFPLISDLTKEISKKFGVLKEDEGIAYRGMLIFDPKGVLRIYHVNDLPIGRNVNEALRLISALRFHEEHGEVCPLNWKEGSDTIVPDPTKSKKFFEKNY